MYTTTLASGLVLAGTGHRPDKVGGYSQSAQNHLVTVARYALDEYQPRKVISGMALGWDQALAQACIDLGIPFIAAVPFAGQESRWPPESQRKWHDLIAHAKTHVVVCDGTYAAWKMQKRNEWMVDASDALLALYDGTEGGTANCVRYAISKKKPIVNLWNLYEEGQI